jgi:hypothetical protein
MHGAACRRSSSGRGQYNEFRSETLDRGPKEEAVPTKKARSARREPRRQTRRTMHQLRVTLSESEPAIWRTFVVPSNIDMGLLHMVLQTVVGWTNSHLHQFVVDGRRISDPRFELDDVQGEEPTVDEQDVLLREVAPKVGNRMVYEYDFGDGWEHDIVVEQVMPFDESAAPICCLDGARSCPPDDCGGVHGYQELLEAMADKSHPEHENLMAWAGGPIDPEAFDARAVNREIARWLLSQT